MSIERVEADYLIVGAGAMGMAFADVVLSEQPSVQIAIVDRHARPGGHWNDAYPFVALHQPAAYYGVRSLPLGSGGSALASGVEILAYYDQVMKKLTGSGRVRFFPMCEYTKDNTIVSTIDPERRIEVDVIQYHVDATYMNVQVPSIRPPAYEVDEGIPIVAPNELGKIRQPYQHYVVIGGGKTGMDAVLFLLEQGVNPRQIRWIVPNDSWFFDRADIQPGRATQTFASPFKHILQSTTLDELFHAKERDKLLLRLDTNVWPTKYRCATVSQEELLELRKVDDVIRLGRVKSINSTAIELEQGTVATDTATLHIDCTADGLSRRPIKPVFEADRITLQSLVMCQQVFSAAVIGHIAGMSGSEAEKNALCRVVPHPEVPRDYLSATQATLKNILSWTPRMGFWLKRCRLNYAHHDSIWTLLRIRRSLGKTLRPLFTRIDELLADES